MRLGGGRKEFSGPSCGSGWRCGGWALGCGAWKSPLPQLRTVAQAQTSSGRTGWGQGLAQVHVVGAVCGLAQGLYFREGSQSLWGFLWLPCDLLDLSSASGSQASAVV